MITSERTITINVNIFTKDLKQLDEIFSTLRQDCIRAVQARKEKLEKTGNKDIQVHLKQDSRCSFCGKLFSDCICGKPAPRPAV